MFVFAMGGAKFGALSPKKKGSTSKCTSSSNGPKKRKPKVEVDVTQFSVANMANLPSVVAVAESTL